MPSLDDHSRVILQPIEDDPSSDYINANYIDVSGNASNATIGSQRNQRNHTPSLVCQASIPLLRLLVIHQPSDISSHHHKYNACLFVPVCLSVHPIRPQSHMEPATAKLYHCIHYLTRCSVQAYVLFVFLPFLLLVHLSSTNHSSPPSLFLHACYIKQELEQIVGH